MALLDRRRLVEDPLKKRDLESLAISLRSIWGNHINQFIADRSQVLEENPNANPTHKSFEYIRAIAKELVDLAGINDNLRYMNLLQNGFRRLGYDVAWLTIDRKDCALIDEEFSWYGQMSELTDEPYDIWVPGKALNHLEVIKDCTPHELMVLNAEYHEAKSTKLAAHWPRGSSYQNELGDVRDRFK